MYITGTYRGEHCKYREFVYRVPVKKPLTPYPNTEFGKQLYEAETEFLKPEIVELVDYRFDESTKSVEFPDLYNVRIWLIPNKYTTANYAMLIFKCIRILSYTGTSKEEADYLIKEAIINGRRTW